MDKNHAEIINFYLQKNIFRDIILKKFYKKQGLTKITAENIILSKQDVYKRQTWALSQQGTRRNCSMCEDAHYPRLDGKTP